VELVAGLIPFHAFGPALERLLVSWPDLSRGIRFDARPQGLPGFAN
jgi:hypothetical protein